MCGYVTDSGGLRGTEVGVESVGWGGMAAFGNGL